MWTIESVLSLQISFLPCRYKIVVAFSLYIFHLLITFTVKAVQTFFHLAVFIHRGKWCIVHCLSRSISTIITSFSFWTVKVTWSETAIATIWCLLPFFLVVCWPEDLIFIYLSIFIQIFCTYVFYNYERVSQRLSASLKLRRVFIPTETYVVGHDIT